MEVNQEKEEERITQRSPKLTSILQPPIILPISCPPAPISIFIPSAAPVLDGIAIIILPVPDAMATEAVVGDDMDICIE